MNQNNTGFDQSSEDILNFQVSDAELEAAAGTTPALAAMSFPNAPTVSVLVYCCGNDTSE